MNRFARGKEGPAGEGRRPAIRRGALPHFRGPRRSPAATAAGSVEKGAAAEGVSFAACGEAKDLELAATLSRFACSRRPASLRLGLVSGPLVRPCAHPRCGPSGLLTTAHRFYSTPFPGKKKEG